MTSKTATGYTVRKDDSHWVITFAAMAGPCEVLVKCKSTSEANDLASLAFSETRRIEHKFSRYRDDNIVHKINSANGASVDVDEETARLLNYADQCHRLSNGLFDVTSGVLRRAWKFDGSSFTPDESLIRRLQEQIGWNKVNWDGKSLQMQPDMEIDFGGIGKEYAVDVVADMLFQSTGRSLMVNFGGDIRAMTSDEDPDPWIVGVEDPDQNDTAIGEIDLTNGAVATSGDVRRFCYVDGVKMGHILNPTTGWPVAEAPRTVTVLSSYCVEAGFLATLAMLQGAEAEEFLRAQGVQYHAVR